MQICKQFVNQQLKKVVTFASENDTMNKMSKKKTAPKIITIEKGTPALKGRYSSDGTQVSLYLEFYIGDSVVGGKRKQTIKKKTICKIPADFDKNNNELRMAKIERNNAEKEYLKNKGFNIIEDHPFKARFDLWLDEYVKAYGSADRRVTIGVVEQFRKFMRAKFGLEVFGANDITPVIAKLFGKELERTHKGEGAQTYYQRFRKMIKMAVDEGLLASDPFANVVVRVSESTREIKEVLNKEEIAKLFTFIPGDINKDIVRAAAVSVRNGLAYVDVRNLTWGNIKDCEIAGKKCKRLVYYRSKTKVAGGGLLGDDVLDILGESGKPKEKVFPNLPQTSEGVNKALKRWVDYAGIDKHITWYCLRHTCATTLMAETNDPISTASIMGHKNPNITLKVYSHAVEERKDYAIKKTMISKYNPANDDKAGGVEALKELAGDLTQEQKLEFIKILLASN